MPRILIIEDEPDMVRGLQFNLEARGYEVAAAGNGESGLEVAASFCPDVVLLDVMLPGRDGFDVCRTLRKSQPALPILMLTARGREDDVVLGLKLGADDYVKKPFSLAELMARIETALRRSSAKGGADTLAFGDVNIDFKKYQATRNGIRLELSAREFDMLRFFASRRGDVVTRDALLDAVWGYNSIPNTRTVDTHIVKLRQKIEPDPSNPRFVITIHGLGYKFLG
jgi:two-component system alkaline phosphatase synthesis response regulator PhoP